MLDSISVQQPRSFPDVFLRCRTIAFGAIAFFSFLWTIFLCVTVFMYWDEIDRPQQSFMAVMLIAHSLTIVMFIFLIVKVFRVWLDAARCFLALIAHIGVAGSYVYWTPRFQCRQPNNNDSLCYTRIVFILASSWLIPAFLVIYSTCLGAVWYKLERQQKAEALEEDDREKTTSTDLDFKLDWHPPHPSGFAAEPISRSLDRGSGFPAQHILVPSRLSVPPTPLVVNSVTTRQPSIHLSQTRQSLRARADTSPSRHNSFYHHIQQPSYGDFAQHLAQSRHHSMRPPPRQSPHPVPHYQYSVQAPGAQPLREGKHKPAPLTLDLSPHAANQQRNLHYSALFQQAPRTPTTVRAAHPASPEVIPPLPSPWTKQRQQSQQYSPSSLEYLKDSPSPPSPARLSKPSPASRVPSL